jgi:hypothetical protein
MTGVARAHFESLRTLGFAGISGTYAAVGVPLLHQVRAFCITNKYKRQWKHVCSSRKL